MLTSLKKKHLFRKLKIYEDSSLLNFTSNDYLNLATHPDVKKAFIKGVDKFGLGSGSSPQVSGYSSAHQELEEQFAEFLGREKALLFNSGYHANVGVIPALANRSTTIYSDKLCHASLIDGISLSRAKHYRYRHADLTNLNLLCQRKLASTAWIPAFAGMTEDFAGMTEDFAGMTEDFAGMTEDFAGMTEDFAGMTEDFSKMTKILFITESVFSMEGDIANIKQLADIKKTRQAKLYVDDAHGIGILGKSGRGIIEHSGVNTDIDCLVTPLGKALGSMGAIVSGSKDFIEMVLQSARTHRYSTAIPAANCVGTLAALNLLRKDNWRREKLFALTQFFIQEADKRGLTLVSRDLTPIKSILIGANETVVMLQKTLLEQGILIAGMRPPTVPQNTARIRVSLNCEHNEKDIVRLLDQLAENIC